MNLLKNGDLIPLRCFFRAAPWFALLMLFLLPRIALGLDPSGSELEEAKAVKLLKMGQSLAEKTQYLEALDLLQEARDILEGRERKNSGILGDVLFALAETKIKARLHQNFPAHYVKTALEDVRAANKLREKISETLPQKLAEGYFLEGYIHKNFFMRKEVALACFRKAVNIDPGLAPAKRELYELLPGEEQKQN